MKDKGLYRGGRHGWAEAGLTLVELMIAMFLGLLVVGGVISVILANSQTYRTNHGLFQVQESARTAFELLARDIRQAAATGCGNRDRIANTLNSAANWWQDWAGILGYDGATAAPAVAFGANAGQRVAGTDAILLQGLEGTGLTVENHDVTAANLKINATTTDFTVGDILMVCDFDHAAIFQVTSYNSNNVTVVHNTGSNPAPGNCSKGLGFPTLCTSNGNPYEFGPNSLIARMTAVTWYVGQNGRADEGGRSLYRVRLGPAASLASEEIVAGVIDMQLRYRQGAETTFVEAPTDWESVTAVEITLTLWSADQRVSTDQAVNDGRLQRTFTTIVGLRNRNG
jgi:type IV pilus assembly protein PilW